MTEPGRKPDDFKRMSGDELSAALKRLGLTPNQFCRMTGAAYKRLTTDWLNGENVPLWVPVLLASWLASPQAFEAAKVEAQSRLL
jgi:hypothetical protein